MSPSGLIRRRCRIPRTGCVLRKRFRRSVAITASSGICDMHPRKARGASCRLTPSIATPARVLSDRLRIRAGTRSGLRRVVRRSNEASMYGWIRAWRSRKQTCVSRRISRWRATARTAACRISAKQSTPQRRSRRRAANSRSRSADRGRRRTRTSSTTASPRPIRRRKPSSVSSRSCCSCRLGYAKG